jgi:hypothetical protein
MANIWSPTIENLENGNVAVSNFPATQAVSATDLDIRNLVSGTDSVTAIGPLTDTELRATPVPVSFSTSALTPTVTRVPVSTSVATLAAANSARQRLVIHNESGTLFVKLGTNATSSDYTYRLVANTTLEIGFAQSAAVTAIKASGASDVQVTSLA